MGVRLPAEYQEVEYLESTRAEYIDTNILPAADLAYRVRFRVYSSEGPGFGNIFGSRLKSAQAEYQLTAYNGGCVSVGVRNFTKGIGVNVDNEVSYDGVSTAVVNGVESKIRVGDKYVDTPIVLFGIRDNGVVTQLQASRIYYLDFIGIASFVPCYRKVDSKPGMYDLISGKFFVNQGTGEFIAGPDVIDRISPWLVARRRNLLQNQKTKLRLRYWYGLNRKYSIYDNWNDTEKRAASDDVFVPAGQTMTITPPDDGQVAVAAWDSDLTNILYGNWNGDLVFTRPYDCTIRIVCRLKTNAAFPKNYFDGKVTVKVGNKTYITV